MTCDNCGMYSPERMIDGSTPPEHVCPEPFPRVVAESYVQMAESMALRGSALIVHPRTKLGLKA